MNSQDILVWLQSTVRRDPSRTIRSIEHSDIGSRFILVKDQKARTFPQDYSDLQQWWHSTWLDMVASAQIRGCRWILRLEDDVLVNRHILHNLCTWSAPHNKLFGLGTLFVPDYWLKRPELFQTIDGAAIRKVKDVEGAQGQLVATDLVAELLAGVPRARQERGLCQDKHPPSFDWSLSRSAWYLGRRVFVHMPALVDLHEESRSSKIDLAQHRGAPPDNPRKHYWGHESFNPTWRRNAAPKQASLGPFFPVRDEVSR